jgi:hypothetical protein
MAQICLELGKELEFALGTIRSIFNQVVEPVDDPKANARDKEASFFILSLIIGGFRSTTKGADVEHVELMLKHQALESALFYTLNLFGRLSFLGERNVKLVKTPKDIKSARFGMNYLSRYIYGLYENLTLWLLLTVIASCRTFSPLQRSTFL